MADLGEAVLKLVVDDNEFRQKLSANEQAAIASARRIDSASRTIGRGALGGGFSVENQRALSQAFQNTAKSINAATDAARRFRTQSGPILGGGLQVATQRAIAQGGPTAVGAGGPTRPLTAGPINPVTGMTRAYEQAVKASAELLENDLRRFRVIREITQRLERQASLGPGFGQASAATFGTQDPVEKSIRRNREKRARDEQRQERANAVVRDQEDIRYWQRRNRRQSISFQQEQRRDAAKRRRDISANVLIGGGFPLLFGQGAGAALGGAVGGGIGGALGGTFGFGASIAGTAIGAAVDGALLKLQELAKGLDNPIKNFEALRQASLLSSRALERQVEALIATGRTAEAELLIRQDLNALLGDTTAATEYLNSVDRLNRAWARGTTILANFASGPLAKFLDFIVEPAQGIQLGAVVASRAAALTPAQQRQFRQFTEQQRAQLPAFPSDTQINEAYQQQLREIARITGSAAKAEKELLTVREAGIKATQAQARARVFGAFGLEGLAASANLQGIRESQNALIPGFTGKTAQEQEQAVQELRKRNLEIATQILDLRNQEIDATARLLQLDEQREQRNEALARSISNSTQLLSVQPGVYRDNLRFIQQIRETLLSASDAQETNLRNLQVARNALGEPTQANAADRERLLSQERQVRLEYVDAAAQVRLSLIEAAERLRDSFRDAALRFTEIRASAQGLNRFLTPQQREGRALANFDILLPLFRAAQRRFTELTGAPAPELVAPTQEALNAGMRDFIEAVNREEASGRILVDTQKALRDVNQNLLSVNERLISATQTLADKNWVVDVQVVNQAGGATTVNAINALSQ